MLLTTSLVFSQNQNVLYSEDLQSGTLDSIEPIQDTDKGVGTIVADPDVADDSQKVLATPDGSTQTYFWHTHPEAARGGGLELSFRFNEDQTNHEWNTSWALMTDPLLNGASIKNGYGIRLGFETTGPERHFWVKLNRCNSGEGAGEEVEIAKVELPGNTLQTGWNTVRFLWAADGTLTGWVNDNKVITAQDNTYEPAFHVLKIANWISNNLPAPEALPEGRKLFFDDIKVVQAE